MPADINPQNTVDPSPDSGNTKTNPTIRTMKSDIDRLFRNREESLVSAVSKEVVFQNKTAKPIKSSFSVPRPPIWFWIVVGAVLFLFLAGGVSYYYGIYLPQQNAPKTPERLPLVIPTPLVPSDKTVTIPLQNAVSVNTFLQQLTIIKNDPSEIGTLKRVISIIRTPEVEKLLSLREFLALLNTSPSPLFYETAVNRFDFYLYYQKEGLRNALVIPILDDLKAFRAMFNDEPFIRDAWEGLYTTDDPRVISPQFNDISYRNIDIRRLQFSPISDIGFYYSIFKPKNYLIITTSYESMQVILDRIFNSL